MSSISPSTLIMMICLLASAYVVGGTDVSTPVQSGLAALAQTCPADPIKTGVLMGGVKDGAYYVACLSPSLVSITTTITTTMTDFITSAASVLCTCLPEASTASTTTWVTGLKWLGLSIGSAWTTVVFTMKQQLINPLNSTLHWSTFFVVALSVSTIVISGVTGNVWSDIARVGVLA